MKIIYLVKYIAHDFIDGFLNKESDFDKWLSRHNKRRVKEGEEPESKFGFEIIPIHELELDEDNN